MKPLFFLFVLLINLQVQAADLSLRNMHLNTNKLPKKVLLISPEIYVNEVSMGGVPERIEAWSEKAKGNVMDAIDAQIDANGVFQTIALPQGLSDAQLDNLDEHIALFDLVAGSAVSYGRGKAPGWHHKRNVFDYTLGDGLNELGNAIDVDAALFVIGQDYISSGGRKAARVFAALLGVILPPSPTFLAVALVDLHSGDILWMSYDVALDTQDLRKPEDVNEMLQDLFDSYPMRGNG